MRQFTNWSIPLIKVMKKCIKTGVLSKLSKDLEKPIRGKDVEAKCKFHQCKGHHTDKCFALRHVIQDLIEQGKIPPPTDSSRLRTQHNPLLRYGQRKNEGFVNAIGSGKPEAIILVEANYEEMTCAIRLEDIWAFNNVPSDSNSSSDEEIAHVKVTVKNSVKVEVGERSTSSEISDSSSDTSDDEGVMEAKKRSLEGQVGEIVNDDEQWYFSEEEVSEVGVQSLRRSGIVYKPEEITKKVDNPPSKKTKEGEREKEESSEEKSEGAKGKEYEYHIWEKKEAKEPSQVGEPSDLTSTSFLELLRQTKASVSLWDLIIASKGHKEALLEAIEFVRGQQKCPLKI